jgi:hypothetical protein
MSCIIELFTNLPMTALANFLGIVATSVAALFSFLNWNSDRQQKAFNESRISIRLQSKENDKIYTLPWTVRRQNLTRSEVQGILGNLLLPGKTKYEIAYLKDNEFSRNLEKAQFSSDTDDIVITCTEKELKVFKLEGKTNVLRRGYGIANYS